MTEVTAYVDGFNLYYGVKAKFGHKYLWLDLVELVRQLRPGDTIAAVRYFTAVVKGEPAAAANQNDYIEALQTHCGATLDVQRGWFKPRGIGPCRVCGDHYQCACPRRFRSYEEKETDVALGATMVEDAAAHCGDRTPIGQRRLRFRTGCAVNQEAGPVKAGASRHAAWQSQAAQAVR